MLSHALTSLTDAFAMLLRNQLEKRALLENLDLVLLSLDETIDDGYNHNNMFHIHPLKVPQNYRRHRRCCYCFPSQPTKT